MSQGLYASHGSVQGAHQHVYITDSVNDLQEVLASETHDRDFVTHLIMGDSSLYVLRLEKAIGEGPQCALCAGMVWVWQAL